MVTLEFDNLTFREKKDTVAVHLMKYFRFEIPTAELLKVSPFKADGHRLIFEDSSEKRVHNKFNQQLSAHIINLKNIITGHDAIYVHSMSGIPLLGYIGFGILDRGSNILEIRPINGCNLNCIYCSVDEGPYSRKNVDFVIEKDYLVAETIRVVEEKDCEIEIHIGPQGEPLLYSDLIGLITDLKKHPLVKKISMDTNGTLLSTEKIDELVKAGLDMFNISLNAIENEAGKKIAGCKENVNYNVEHVKEMVEYVATKTPASLIIAPVYAEKMNDDQVELLVLFSKKLIKRTDDKKVRLCFQNFLSYKRGRNAGKEITYEKFYELLQKLEDIHEIKLIVTKDDFDIKKERAISRPFHKGDAVKVRIVSPGRNRDEYLGAAERRLISIASKDILKVPSDIRVKIIKEKDGIFFGVPS